MGRFRTGFTRSILLLLSLSTLSVARAKSLDEEEQKMIERINKRYDDFFHRQREDELEDEKRRKGIPALEKQRHLHAEELKKARELYVKNHKVAKRDPKLEEKWDEQQAARRELNRAEGRRYLERELTVEKAEERGRHIPQNLEFDLEN